jgi:hypothetical protein
MKKFAILLVVLSLTRIGVAYADTTKAADSQNYFFGTKSAAANLNQVLALLVGPKGDPGAAGVAGKDGLIGMDGKDGKDGLNGLNGLDGAPGAVGQAGAAGTGVLSVAFTGVQGGCTVGGVKFTDGAGKTTFACNGINGTDGTGGNGGTTTTITQVVTGPVSGYTYAQGAVLVGTCDSFVAIKPIRSFTRMGFGFSGFVIGDTTTVVNVDSSTTLNGGISTDCNANPVLIEFFTDTAYADAPYSADDHIVCTSRNAIGTYGSVTNGSRAVRFDGGTYKTANDPGRSAALASGDFRCVADSAPNASFALVYINTADYTDKIGFQIG